MKAGHKANELGRKSTGKAAPTPLLTAPTIPAGNQDTESSWTRGAQGPLIGFFTGSCTQQWLERE